MKTKPLIGSWISLSHPGTAEIFAKKMFDWVVVDLEHSTISVESAGDLIRVISLAGSIPLVRLTSNHPDQIKRVMDAGAHGVVVPNVTSPEEARQAVSATRYPPLGSRGVGLARAQGYGSSFREYWEWQKREPIVILQIENISALDSLEEIFSIPLVSGFMIGPYDLSASMGIPGKFESQEFKKIKRKILETGKKTGCPPGIHIVEPEPSQLLRAVREGFHWIAYSSDMRMLEVTARSGLRSLGKFR